MTNHKCESCRKGFNGQNCNGYMPCSCKQPTIIDGPDIDMTPAKPKFVPAPAPLIISDHSLFIVYSWKYRACLYFVLGLMVGIVGCLYAASYLS
ncbi:hypothetical protein [Acinetobacter sp. SWBY1]|uniref:hypothetical protein n=1 Tax=Acinetobacter sp. SWBY1 TaxID=2079596 RepID=UPI000CF200D2|nr:hypothetical protein [Acinetobacter sp. SWBY1]AVH48655.1 hypothetical protein C3Y93_02925 [Acinetobacter sp. SWBY1]